MLTINSNKRSQNAPAFTIVELLIVIVVIAILATITIVTYNGIQARARASAASQALSQAKKKLELYKVDTATYPTTGNLSAAGITNTDTTYQYTSDGSTYCLTGTNSSAIYRVTDATSPTSGGCSGHTWQGGVAMTNVVANGDFTQGTSGWWSGASTYSAAGGIFSNTGNGGSRNPHIVTGVPGGLIASNKYYFAARARASSSGTVGFQTYNGSTTFSLLSSPVQNTWYNLSTIYTASGGYGYAVLYHSYADAGTANGKTAEVDWVLLVNLTATFGAGNEPTKAQMDTIMQQFPNNWFSGTVTADTRGIL